MTFLLVTHFFNGTQKKNLPPDKKTFQHNMEHAYNVTFMVQKIEFTLLLQMSKHSYFKIAV